MTLKSELIQCVVQHDPRRAALLPPLLAQLPGAQAVADPGASEPRRSPWRCYRACLQALEPGASHLLVVQDDAILCRDFAQAIPLLAAARPDDPLCLFVPGVGANQRRVLQACASGALWAELDPLAWVPCVAVLWPRAQAEALLAFAEQKRYPESRSADDAIVGDFSRETRTRFLAPVPSLCDHDDSQRSLVGTANWSGLSPARVAACWLGAELSPLSFAW